MINWRLYHTTIVLKDIQTILNDQYFQKWKDKKSSKLPKLLEDNHLDTKFKVWRGLNIKRSAFLQVVRMQENAFMMGNKRVYLTGNSNSKYCRFCENNDNSTFTVNILYNQEITN